MELGEIEANGTSILVLTIGIYPETMKSNQKRKEIKARNHEKWKILKCVKIDPNISIRTMTNNEQTSN